MKFENINNNNIDHVSKTICKTHLVSVILENAINNGWRVEQQNNKVYILRKKINKLTKKEKNTDELMDVIFDVKNF